MSNGDRDQGAPPRLPAGATVAVTGASGFIGGRLVERLVEDGAAVTCFLRGKPGDRLAATGAAARKIDLADTEAVRTALAGVDYLFHCAYDWNDIAWNHAALAALIAGCRAHGTRLVHVSTFVVYDVPPAGELTEETAVSPDRGGYGDVKNGLERALFAAVREGGLAAAAVQPTIVYGPHSKPWTIDPADMLHNGTVILPDAGEGVCNAVYVDDVIDGMILAATEPAAIGRRYLISGEPVSWGQFYEAIAAAIGARGPTYLPSATIAREHDRDRRVMRLVTSPGTLLRALAVRRPLRGLTECGLRLLPGAARRYLDNQLFAPLERRRGHRHMPDPGRLGMFQGRATIRSLKARRELGYAPRFDLAAGMAQTARYLQDRYRR